MTLRVEHGCKLRQVEVCGSETTQHARRFKCCIILCDLAWLDPDMKVSNGISATEQRDMLRLDAMIMMVQMNIRKLINVRADSRQLRRKFQLGFHAC